MREKKKTIAQDEDEVEDEGPTTLADRRRLAKLLLAAREEEEDEEEGEGEESEEGATSTDRFRKQVSTRSMTAKVWEYRGDKDVYRQIRKDNRNFGPIEVDHVVECQVVRDAFDRLRAAEQAKQAIVVGLRYNCVNIPETLNTTNKDINLAREEVGGKRLPGVLQERFANQVNTSRYQPRFLLKGDYVV